MDRESQRVDAFSAELADALRLMREQRGMSQSALARELGHDQAMVSRIEAAQRRVTVEDLFMWGEALGAAAAEIAALAADLWRITAGRPPSLWDPADP